MKKNQQQESRSFPFFKHLPPARAHGWIDGSKSALLVFIFINVLLVFDRDMSEDLVNDIINRPFRISDEQIRAVLSDSQYTRIIAGAGAGKTETITRRIAYLILAEGISPSNIVAFTFTDKAAQSMKSRIYGRVEEIAGQEATSRLGVMYVGTIHSYAKQVLDDNFGFGNYSVLDANQEIAYLMRHGWELNLENFGRNYSDRILNFHRTVNMVQSELLDESNLAIEAPHFFISYSRYLALLQENKLLTFGRMISQVVARLRENPDTLGDVHYLLIDEYQDINRAQQEFIHLVAGENSIYIVGDPRQSIYQWRGSDQSYFYDFNDAYPDVFTVNIPENHRSLDNIVYNANSFSDSFQQISVSPMNPVRGREGYIGYGRLDRPRDEANWIIDQIEQIMDENKSLNYSDFGILMRSVSTAAPPIIAVLNDREIPYIVGGKVGLFHRDEAQVLGRLFAWFWEDGFWNENPYNASERIVGDSLIDSAIPLWMRTHPDIIPETVRESLVEIKLNLSGDTPEHQYNNFTDIFHDVLIALGFEQLNHLNPIDAAVMANLGRFNTLLTDFETANRIGGGSIRWQPLLRGLCWFMNSYGLRAYEEQPADDVRGINAIQITTVHQAKGLEWPIVFLVSLTNRRFPPSRLGVVQNWCGIPRELFNASRYESTIEDERRLFYVAITRPRDALILTNFRRMQTTVGPSPLLRHVDLNYIQELDRENLPSLTIESTSNPGDEIQTFSAGELISYTICPYMYLLRQLWGYQPGLNQRIGYGNALHYCLRRTGELVLNEGLDPRAAVMYAVESGFHMPFMSGRVLNDFKNRTFEVLRNFVNTHIEDITRIQEVEYRLEYPLQNATLLGKVDVILDDEGALEVRDYKSIQGYSEEDEDIRTHEEAEVQVRLYALGLQSLGRNVDAGSVAYLGDGVVRDVAINEDTLGGARDIAENTINNIVNRVFNPCDGTNCNRCDFTTICRWSNNEA